MSGITWLASYPKSGNTWLRFALRSLVKGGAAADFSDPALFAPVATYRSVFEAVLGVESSDLTEDEILALRPRVHEAIAAASEAPVLRKTHDAWCEALFARPSTHGAAYIVRDPRDVAVSYAHHAEVAIDAAVAFLGDPEATLPPRCDGHRPQLRQRLLTWSEHVVAWIDRSGLAPLLVRYEDMHRDPVESLARVAGYLDWRCADATIALAVAASRFEALQAEEARHGFREKPPGLGQFFRRGVAGGWRDSLTRGQAARIERDHGTVMARLGYR